MATSEDDAKKKDETESGSAVPKSDETESAADTKDESATSPADAAAETEPDELPDWIPMTPEFAEEEAMRGDFMLRWAVILMALLMGFTEIATTQTFVHVKSGEQIADNGFLPLSTDTLSYSAEGKAWTNLAWGYDLIAAQIYSLGGMNGLTILKALLAAVTFGVLVHTSLAGIPSWWTAICGAIALIACYPRFTATPELITLLGLALTLAFMNRWAAREKSGFPWQLPVLFVVWSNLDPRLFLGLVVVLAYAIGRTLAGARDESAPPIKSVWGVALACVVAACANPSLFQTLLEPSFLYSNDYPFQQMYHSIAGGVNHLQYFSVFQPNFMRYIGVPEIAVLTIAIVTLVIFILHMKQLDLGYFFVFLAFVGVGCLANREMSALALVCAGIASTIGQRYYRSSFKQEYTIETAELLFSRGGRAVTVLGMFAIAFLFASGRLAGPGGPRVGLGLQPNLAETVAGLKSDLEDFEGENLFHFTAEQGDLLIWLGKKSFIDNRAALFARAAVDLKDQHHETRVAMRKRGEEAQPEKWKSTFAEHNLSIAIPRLFGDLPDTGTYAVLRHSPDWKLLKLGSAAAVFATKGGAGSYAAEDFVKQAFRTPVKDSVERPDWGREPGFNEKYLFPPRRNRPQSLATARACFMDLLSMSGQQIERSEESVRRVLGEMMARAYIGIRAANKCLSEDPQNADAYYMLASLYGQLNNLELSIGPGAPQEMRYLQIVGALHQCLKIQPDHTNAQQLLEQTYLGRGRYDAALPLVNLRLTAEAELLDDSMDAFEAHRERMKTRDQLAETVEKNTAEVEKILGQAKDEEQLKMASQQLAAFQRDRGFIVKALELLEDDAEGATLSVPGQILYGMLLLENGEVERANTVLRKLESMANEFPDQFAGVKWQFAVGVSCLTNGLYSVAEGLWGAEATACEQQRVPFKMRVSQIAFDPRAWLNPGNQSAMNGLVQLPVQSATARMYLALCYLEEGRTNDCRGILNLLLDAAPEAPVAPLAAFYLSQINGEKWLPPEFPDDFIQIAEAPPEKPKEADDSQSSEKPDSANSEPSKEKETDSAESR